MSVISESEAESAPITRALRAWRAGSEEAGEAVMRLVYPHLHERAARLLRGERPDHTLQPTALVHEAYLRLLDQRAVAWNDRLHFFAIASRLMRRVLLDHARRRGSAKRGAGVAPLPLELLGDLPDQGPGVAGVVDVEDLDRALAELESFDPAGAAIVELRFFGGLTIDETAAVRGCSVPTVVRQWRAARAWLYDRLRTDS